MLSAALIAAIVATESADAPVRAARAPRPALTVSPSAGGRHDRFAVAITLPRATGVLGRTRRAYLAEAHAVHPASGCVGFAFDAEATSVY